MEKMLRDFYHFECHIFQAINNHFDKRLLNLFFRTITHMGGATFTIFTVVLIAFFPSEHMRLLGISCGAALSASHIPVHFAKIMYPRKRPYIILEKTKFPKNPLADHSFPSGHTTAIFSLIIPIVLSMPFLTFVLLPIGLSVGLSRIYLGLHYPSDVFAGGMLGTILGFVAFNLLGI